MLTEQQVMHEAEQMLETSSHSLRGSVRCRFTDGVLTLTGRVPSFYLKQTAQSLVQGIHGVHRIDNALSVVAPRGVSSEPPLRQR